MSNQEILAIPPSEWVTASCICLGWMDGPTDAVARLARPDVVLHAEMVANRPTEDDLDERIFRATVIPRQDFDSLMAALAPIGPPILPSWIPLWQFPTEADKQRAEAAVAAIRARRNPTLWLFTSDMKSFGGVWLIDADSGLEGDPLFAKLLGPAKA